MINKIYIFFSSLQHDVQRAYYIQLCDQYLLSPCYVAALFCELTRKNLSFQAVLRSNEFSVWYLKALGSKKVTDVGSLVINMQVFLLPPVKSPKSLILSSLNAGIHKF